jgi:hypothetical protein
MGIWLVDLSPFWVLARLLIRFVPGTLGSVSELGTDEEELPEVSDYFGEL